MIQIEDMFGKSLAVGDKVIYCSTGQYATLHHVEIENIYEALPRWSGGKPVVKVQIRMVTDDGSKGSLRTLEYKSRRLYKL